MRRAVAAAPERPVTSRAATRTIEPDLRALTERCHLVLVVGCLACERYVRLRHRPVPPAVLAVDVRDAPAPPSVLLPVPEPYPVGAAGRLAADRDSGVTPFAPATETNTVH